MRATADIPSAFRQPNSFQLYYFLPLVLPNNRDRAVGSVVRLNPKGHGRMRPRMGSHLDTVRDKD